MNPSAILRALTGAFGAYHPMRLMFGLGLGALTKMVVTGLALTYPETRFWAALDSYAIHWFILIAAPLPFVPLIFSKGGAPEGVMQQIRTLQALLDAGEASEAQRAITWRTLTAKYLDNVKPDLSGGKTLQDLVAEQRDNIARKDDEASA